MTMPSTLTGRAVYAAVYSNQVQSLAQGRRRARVLDVRASTQMRTPPWAQDPIVAEVAGAALARLQRTTAHHVAVLTDPEYLANSRAVLEAKLPLLTQQVWSMRARAAADCG